MPKVVRVEVHRNPKRGVYTELERTIADHHPTGWDNLPNPYREGLPCKNSHVCAAVSTEQFALWWPTEVLKAMCVEKYSHLRVRVLSTKGAYQGRKQCVVDRDNVRIVRSFSIPEWLSLPCSTRRELLA